MAAGRKSAKQRMQAELARRQKSRREADGWQPPAAPEAAWLKLKPVAAAAEGPEDRAVFDPSVGGQLSPDLAAEAARVREALEMCAQGELYAAVDHLIAIDRRSPFADWRLFVRGLVAFQRSDLAAAREAWKRLDPTRRPARIAHQLDAAWERATAASEGGQPEGGQAADGRGPAASGVSVAAEALMRRASRWGAAREIATTSHRDEDRTFSASQAALAIRLEKQYRDLDPDFIREFSAACRALALNQPDDQPFLAICRSTAGPVDDPRNTRLQSIHLHRFLDTSEEVRQATREYVDRDLPGLSQLPAPLRAALASAALDLAAAHVLAAADSEFGGGVSAHEEQVCERLLREAIERYPRNRRGHEALIKLLTYRAADDGAESDTGRALANAKLAFVKLFPDQHRHVVDLIDRFIKQGDFARAEPLVRSLADQRIGDAVGRAATWRFELLRSASLAAADDTLPRARTGLEAAIAAWPAWMDRQWIPFLEAALLLREGDAVGCNAILKAAREQSAAELPFDFMFHEAVRRLHGAGPRAEPFRARLHRAAREIAIDSSLVPLLKVACFCMDLERSGLPVAGDDHPAWAIGRALCQRLAHGGGWQLGSLMGQSQGPPVDDPGFWPAFRWLAAHDFFGVVNPKREPKGIARLADTHPRAAAEMLAWITRSAPDLLPARKAGKRLALVEKAVATEPDPEVRRRLADIVAAAHEAAEEAEERARDARFHAKATVFPMPSDFHDVPDLPPFLQLILDRGGPEALSEILPVLMGPQNERNANKLRQFANRLGISLTDMMDAMGATPAPQKPRARKGRRDA
jgi:hypothetical protein